MTEFNYENLVKNLPDAFRKDTDSNNYKLFLLIKKIYDKKYSTSQSVFDILDIDNAKGAVLDMYGERFNLKRGPSNDMQYLIRLKSKISQSLSDGSRDSIAKALAYVLSSTTDKIQIKSGNTTGSVHLVDIPLHLLLEANFTTEQIIKMIDELLSVGVHVSQAEFSGTFEFGESMSDYDETKGFADLEQTIGGYFGLVNTQTATGYPLLFFNSTGDSLIDYKIYGTTTEDETPQYVGDLVTDTASEHYGEYDVPVNVTGKNIIRCYTTITHPLTVNAYGNTIVINGNSTSNAGINYLDTYKTLLRKGTYTFTYFYDSGTTISNQYGMTIGLRKSDDRWLAYITTYSSNYQNASVSKRFTVSSDTYVSFGLVGKGNYDNWKFKFQLEYGADSTDYEPYKCETTHIYIDEPLKNGDTLTYSDTGISVTTFKGTNNITLGTSVAPSNMEINYYITT